MKTLFVIGHTERKGGASSSLIPGCAPNTSEFQFWFKVKQLLESMAQATTHTINQPGPNLEAPLAKYADILWLSHQESWRDRREQMDHLIKVAGVPPGTPAVELHFNSFKVSAKVRQRSEILVKFPYTGITEVDILTDLTTSWQNSRGVPGHCKIKQIGEGDRGWAFLDWAHNRGFRGAVYEPFFASIPEGVPSALQAASLLFTYCCSTHKPLP